MSAETIEIIGVTEAVETRQDKEDTENLVNARTAPCRFCDRPGAKGRYRAPGPLGPICRDCLDAGRDLCRDGKERLLGGLNLARLVTAPGVPCEFCDRDERRPWLRHAQPLPRMRRVPGDSVICADCLERGAQLLARVSGVCHG